MLDYEFEELLKRIENRKCEDSTLEIKSAYKNCPERLYDTFSSFSNQDEGGTIVFGIDEKQNYKEVGVYDPQDLQKKLMEIGETMTPIIRPITSVFNKGSKVFVTAEIPPVDLADRPCFKTAKGRLKGSYVRVGDADKPMTEYEVYSYEAFRRKTNDELRGVEGVSIDMLNHDAVEQYILKRKLDRPHFSATPKDMFYELAGITRENKVTLLAILLFCVYPQAYFPQLSIICSCVPGKDMGTLGEEGERFLDSKRIEGTIFEMLESAVGFVRKNMKTSLKINQKTGMREDTPEYPLDAVREIILNALIHRDYSVYTENKPIQIKMFSDRLEVVNPGGLYGRLTVDQLGKIQPETRNPFLVTTMELLGQTENRHFGIPRIEQAMKELKLPKPEFQSVEGEFSVCLYNSQSEKAKQNQATNFKNISDPKNLLEFCGEGRTRAEIGEYLGFTTVQYGMKKYVEPLIKAGAIKLSNPNHPKSPNQIYKTKF